MVRAARSGRRVSAGPEKVGDRTTTQAVHSLRLLPSGPDRVGEGPARRRPPTALYHLPTPPRQASHHGCSRLHDYLKPPVEFSAHLVFHDLTAAGIWVRLGAIKFACRVPEPTNRQWRSSRGRDHIVPVNHPSGEAILLNRCRLSSTRSNPARRPGRRRARRRCCGRGAGRHRHRVHPWRAGLAVRSARSGPRRSGSGAGRRSGRLADPRPHRQRRGLRIGGEKMHTALLRQFYAAYDFQPVWEGRKLQAEALLRARGPRRRPWARP